MNKEYNLNQLRNMAGRIGYISSPQFDKDSTKIDK